MTRLRFACFPLLAILFCVTLALSAPTPAWAQGAVTSGSVSGDVVDHTGAIMVGAKVTVINKATGQERQTTTDANGHFSVLQLPPGSYTVKVEQASFQTALVGPVDLAIGVNRRLKISMKVGEVTQNVEVSAEAVTIDTSSSEVANLIQTVQLRELPLNQRSFTALVIQQPGLVQITSTAPPSVLSAATNTGSYISADGSMGSAVAYLMDGVNFSNGSFTAPGTAAAGDMPGVEAIQEFKVLSHSYSAAYGGASAAVVSFATKTGTNEFHGSVYEFFRNSGLDARRFFDPVSGVPPFRRNQFGATFGGPIKKNKTFFFINYEGLRQNLTTTQVGFVPTECARNGGSVLPLDPVVGAGSCPLPPTRPPVLPGGMPVPVPFSPDVQAIMNLYPLPNGADLGAGVAQLFFPNPQPTRQDFGVVNFTHAFGANDQFSARYQIVDANANSAFNSPNFEFLRQDRLQNLLLKWTHTFRSNLVNTLAFSFLRQRIFSTTEPIISLAPNQVTGNSTRNTIGVMTVGQGTAGTTSGTLSLLGNDDASPFNLAKNAFPINDDLLWVKGKHSLKFGGMVQRFQWNWKSGVIPGGSYTFPTLNDFMAGNPSVMLIRRDDAVPHYNVRTTQIAWYVEDSWRIRNNVTLNIGLRHEFQVPILKELNDRLGNWQSPTDTSIHVGIPYNNYSTTQFQPRIGIAWDPWGKGKTVIRAGYGLFNDFVDYAGNAQGQLQWNSPNPVLNTYFGESLLPFQLLPQIPFPTCDGTPLCTQASPFAGLVTGVLLPMNSPTANQWNLEVQHELPASLVVTLNYTGSQSYHIPRKIEANHNIPCGGIANPTLDSNGFPVFPFLTGTGPFGGFENCAPLGTAAPGVVAIGFSLYSKRYDTIANYHAFTVKVGRSVGSLIFNASYTFAKALSQSDAFNSQNILTGVAQASVYPPDARFDYSESGFSIRHRFTENVVWEIPLGRKRKYMSDAGGVVDAILGGWNLSSLGTFQSGQPFSVLAGVDSQGLGDFIDFPERSDWDGSGPGGVTCNFAAQTCQYFDPTAFTLPVLGHMGTSPRTPMRGPGFSQLDFAIGKRWALGERANLNFRTDIFNIANHPNFGLPLARIFQDVAGTRNPQAGSIPSTVGVPRQIQFSLKLSF